ncbi:LPS export ABC transporter periplasmic protein LptC [Caldichromatium japonicum]|uniref:LPS export ABC transporter periplasmic protein LptC n=1 Tax=Caldichromatium japonicum TaxID=2699430 RepID=A0A6G7VAP6_9GAMM|nr:LPS export ABC transporter periplasmic protein LptC [Caldichromatium japonicum]QIK36945.1 LPS export ABC transporter periplasmic protein LptC [Caldichromatium japonicum]
MRAEHGLARRYWLLGLGLGLLGLITWWQVQRLPKDIAMPTPHARHPDYRVVGFTALETDAQGQPSRRLTAAGLRHFADEDLSELDQPRLILYRADGPPWLAESRSGLVRAGGDAVQLLDEVRLERARGPHNRAVHLKTERLDIWRQQGLAETDLPVQIESDGETLTANGMRLWYLEDAMRGQFKGRARIRLNPATGTPQL